MATGDIWRIQRERDTEYKGQEKTNKNQFYLQINSSIIDIKNVGKERIEISWKSMQNSSRKTFNTTISGQCFFRYFFFWNCCCHSGEWMFRRQRDPPWVMRCHLPVPFCSTPVSRRARQFSRLKLAAKKKLRFSIFLIREVEMHHATELVIFLYCSFFPPHQICVSLPHRRNGWAA